MSDYVYHYCAMHQKNPMETRYIDGTITLNAPISGDKKTYKTVKSEIAKQDNCKKIILISLSLLSPAPEGEG